VNLRQSRRLRGARADVIFAAMSDEDAERRFAAVVKLLRTPGPVN
jgi:hypothetical protein